MPCGIFEGRAIRNLTFCPTQFGTSLIIGVPSVSIITLFGSANSNEKKLYYSPVTLT